MLPRVGLDGLVTIAALLNFMVSAAAFVAFRRVHERFDGFRRSQIGILRYWHSFAWSRDYAPDSFVSWTLQHRLRFRPFLEPTCLASPCNVRSRLCRTQNKNELIDSLISAPCLQPQPSVLTSPLLLVAVRMSVSGHVKIAYVAGPLPLLAWQFLPAFIFSICFAICHHLGTAKSPAGKTGKGMSRVYSSKHRRERDRTSACQLRHFAICDNGTSFCDTRAPWGWCRVLFAGIRSASGMRVCRGDVFRNRNCERYCLGTLRTTG